ncbi:hypothetical protein QUF79_14680 [Fictibacillus enclensis]|uniref:hypothetical protein n=1 Tax=Fictibacillus enclensis TaxID=1017270 RepID=UPI0025A0B998|nr:hypothetical protein [Fictibacillus enclensis]MDM5199264.1 hypothetical protein [Fictibacillus enclensis]
MRLTETDKHKRVAKMCREILDSENPLTFSLANMEKREAILTIDFLLRAVLGYAEKEIHNHSGSMDYIEEKFFSAYKKVTKKEIYP